MITEKMSNLTPEEEFRIFGQLSRANTEMLLDSYATVGEGGVDDVPAHIHEALAQYPGEDFLADVVVRIHEVAKRVRGDNRATLIGIAEALDDIAMTTMNAVGYGQSELHVALNKIAMTLAK